MATSRCTNCEPSTHQEVFLLRREWCAILFVGSVVCRARTVPLAFTLPFNSTTGTQNLNPALEERNGRGAQWVLDAAPARVCRRLPRPKPKPQSVTSFAAWRRSAATARARDWASGNPTRSHLCRTSTSHVTHQHQTSRISITQRDASCISLQDLIMALRNIGVMRVLRINAKHLQV